MGTKKCEGTISLAASLSDYLSSLRLGVKGQVRDSEALCSRVGSATDCRVALNKLPSLSEPRVTSWALPRSDTLDSDLFSAGSGGWEVAGRKEGSRYCFL